MALLPLHFNISQLFHSLSRFYLISTSISASFCSFHQLLKVLLGLFNTRYNTLPISLFLYFLVLIVSMCCIFMNICISFVLASVRDHLLYIIQSIYIIIFNFLPFPSLYLSIPVLFLLDVLFVSPITMAFLKLT